MDILKIIIQILIGLGLLNVWILRFNKKTSYRGGGAENLQHEFDTYGLPGWFMWVIGALKVAAAVAMLAGIFFPVLVFPAAILLIILMLGAIVMHIKVKDPLLKSLPATAMLVLSLILVFI